MVSKGIEALEYYIDPTAEAQVDEAANKPEEPGATTDGSASTAIPGQPPGQPVAPVSPDQPAVFCQKGKCYPYDPSKVKGVNLEAKPGMIIQAVPTTSSQKKANPTAPPPQRGSSPPQKGHKGQMSPGGQKARSRDDDNDEERAKSKLSATPKAGRL